MELSEIVKYSGGGVLLLLTLIQVTPLKINPWSAIARALGRAFNAETTKGIDNIRKDITEMRQDIVEVNEAITDVNYAADLREAINCRRRILIFDDELRHDVRHSEEHFGQILRDIAYYDRYWHDHPEFDNGKTSRAEKHIDEVYNKCVKDNSFL